MAGRGSRLLLHHTFSGKSLGLRTIYILVMVLGIGQRVHAITFYDAGWMMRLGGAVVVDSRLGHHFRFHNLRGRGDGVSRRVACCGGSDGVRPVCRRRLPGGLAVGADCLRRPLHPLAVWTKEKRSSVAFTAFAELQECPAVFYLLSAPLPPPPQR